MDISTAKIGTSSSDPSGAIHPESVDVHLVEEIHRAFNEVLPHFVPTEVGTCIPPRRRATIVVVEIDAAPVALGPPVEAPDAKIRGAKVVVDHVEQHGDATFVAGVDESLKAAKSAVGFFHCEDMTWVVAP